MKVSELKTEMDGKFTAVDAQLNELRQLITTEGDATRQEFRQLVKTEGDATRQEVRQLVKAEGDALRQEVRQLVKTEGDALRQEVRQLVKAEGETTRRHFDVVAEKLTTERNLVLDRSMATAQQVVGLTASNAGDHVRFEHRLDDHERRIDSLEKARDTDPQSR